VATVVTVVTAGMLAGAFAGCGQGASSTPTTVEPSFATALGAGVAALKLGNDNAAQQLFAEAVARRPGNATALYDLGLAYQDEGHARDALRAYAHALVTAPNDVPVEFNRAVIYAAHDAPLAMFLYRRVIHLQPNSPTAYLNLGLLEAAAHLPAAPVDLQKAVQLDPSLAAHIPPTLRPTAAAAPTVPTSLPTGSANPTTTS
jgi:tetratricopeptide (TPR) repeat protein